MKNTKQVTVVTGASSGIGLELARVFAAHGHDLVLVARSEKKLLELKQDLEAKHSITAHVIRADLSTPTGTTELIETIQSHNLEVDSLVNNAGLGAFGYFGTETPWQQEKEMLQVNIFALTELCKAFVPAMVARKSGKILNVASTAAFQPGPMMAVYFATKAYVLHFSEAIAEELEGSGVSVTALCPGATESGFQAAASMEESALFKNKKIPTSHDVAVFGYQSLMSKKRVAIHGLANCLLAQSVRFAPRIVATKLAKKFQEKNN